VPAARFEALPLKFSDGAWFSTSSVRRLSSESIRLSFERKLLPRQISAFSGVGRRCAPGWRSLRLTLSEETAGVLSSELLFPVRRKPKTRANHDEMPPFFLA
jgi:hypothetical protein